MYIYILEFNFISAVAISNTKKTKHKQAINQKPPNYGHNEYTRKNT